MRRLLRKPLAALCATGLIAMLFPTGSLAAAHAMVSGAAPAAQQLDVDATRGAALAGIVLDVASREPVAGATITVGPAQTVAGTDGRFTLAAASGDATLTVAAPGYFTLTTTVAIGPSGGSTVELMMVRQSAKQDSTHKKYFVGSTLFMLANLIPDNNPPEMFYLNLGYRVTGKDVISLELKTWKYAWPIGIPFGKSHEAEGEGFPGYIRERGVSLNYQRFLRNGLFAQVDVMPAWQTFVNDNGDTIDNGFQIFNTYSIGYHVKLFKDRFFIQPSVAITHRPYQSKMPDSFKQVDDRWPRFFYGQPGLHFGYNF